MAILFLKGTSASYHAAGFTPIDDVFYFLTDTKDFYLGSRKLTSDQDLADAVANIATNAADIATIKADVLKKVDRELNGSSGKALIFNENDGGGAKFEHTDGTWSFVGVNDGGKTGITGQIYSVDHNNGNLGTRLNITSDGFFYTRQKTNASYTASDELATLADVQSASGNADSKTVYLKDETLGQSEYAKVYHLYQGSDSVDMTKNVDLGEINFVKDKVVSGGKVVTVTSEIDSDGDAATGLADGTYIKLFVQNQTEALYLNVHDLVEDFSVAIGATQVQLAVSSTRELSAELVDGGVTPSKLAQTTKDLFDEAGAADAVLGNVSDVAGSPTVYGALAAAEAAKLVWGTF